jgi:flagellar motor protein MotB
MSRGKLVVVSLVWLVILGICAVTYKWFLVPAWEQQAIEAKEEERNKILTETGASGRYDYAISLSLDSFSGYALLRSPEFAEELAAKRIKLNLVDDGADYAARLKSLESGTTQIGTFTIDALVKVCSQADRLPVTIIAMIDETRGADAMVSYKQAIPNLDALNHKDTKFILTADSPSETLARVVLAHFNLTHVNTNSFVSMKDAEEVYKKYRAAKPDERQVFVLWQPYVSKVLENPNTHIVVDSSRFRGYIVDVLVVNRDYLYANRDVVAAFLESYFRTNYYHQDHMMDLVLKDAQQAKASINPAQAKALTSGIWWKNTQENYSHFGLQRAGNLQHIEDIIANITKVLKRTGGIGHDPTAGKPNLLYHPELLAGLKDKDFHPGAESIRKDDFVLNVLTDNQWQALQPVGTLEIPPLVFARGTDRLTEQSQYVLDELIKTLESFPQYYLLIKGSASNVGDLKANRALAESRARAAEGYLKERGVNANRLKVMPGQISNKIAVEFVLGQLPY